MRSIPSHDTVPLGLHVLHLSVQKILIWHLLWVGPGADGYDSCLPGVPMFSTEIILSIYKTLTF